MTILIVEPFYGGSHKQLIDLICYDGIAHSTERYVLYTLPAKKWHWRARTSALYLSQTIPQDPSYTVLFCSCVLNLTELVALRPDLQSLHKIIYFHENQLVYPVRKQQQRDFQYGYNQVLSCLVADVVLFNSEFNRDSFLQNISTFFKLMPDYRPKNLAERIRPKCSVLYFPIQFPADVLVPADNKCNEISTESCKVPVNIEHGVVPAPTYCSDSSKVSGDDKDSDVTASMTADDDTVGEPACCTDSSSAPSEHQCLNSNSRPSDGGHCMSSRVPAVCLDSDSEPAHQLESRQPLPAEIVTDELCSLRRPAKILADSSSLLIVWPHRWEHDKDPEAFFKILYELDEMKVEFRLCVVGQTYTDVPEIFAEARDRLKQHIEHWGYTECRSEYYRLLLAADVVVSTALHEFYGVAMLEAVYLGCYPLCPRRLVYPEIFPDECLYNTNQQLLNKLKTYCTKPSLVRNKTLKMDLEKFSWNSLRSQYKLLLGF